VPEQDKDRIGLLAAHQALQMDAVCSPLLFEMGGSAPLALGWWRAHSANYGQSLRSNRLFGRC